MTTATATVMNGAMETAARPRRSLEELVDRVIDALFAQRETAAASTPVQSAARRVHEARRLRQAGDLDGALAVMGGLDVTGVDERGVRWAYAEWLDLVRRRFSGRDVLLYSPGAGRAAALTPMDGGALEVAAVLGMRWAPGKAVSRRSLRGLRPLAGGGASWS